MASAYDSLRHPRDPLPFANVATQAMRPRHLEGDGSLGSGAMANTLFGHPGRQMRGYPLENSSGYRYRTQAAKGGPGCSSCGWATLSTVRTCLRPSRVSHVIDCPL